LSLIPIVRFRRIDLKTFRNNISKVIGTAVATISLAIPTEYGPKVSLRARQMNIGADASAWDPDAADTTPSGIRYPVLLSRVSHLKPNPRALSLST